MNRPDRQLDFNLTNSVQQPHRIDEFATVNHSHRFVTIPPHVNPRLPPTWKLPEIPAVLVAEVTLEIINLTEWAVKVLQVFVSLRQYISDLFVLRNWLVQ